VARPTQNKALSDDQIVEMIDLLKGVDSVELKLTVPESQTRSTVVSLGMDPLDAEIRQVVFFDTPDLALNQSGVVLRARRLQGGKGDSVVKLRPVVPETLGSELRSSPSLGVEVDAMPGGFICSASMKGRLTSKQVWESVKGERQTRDLFTKEQRAFYKEHAPEGLRMSDLKVLGPITLLKLKFVPKDFDRSMVAEMWMYPNGSRLLELSTKCRPSETFQVAAESRAFLVKRGVDISGEQQTKTKTALRYFSSALKGPDAA